MTKYDFHQDNQNGAYKKLEQWYDKTISKNPVDQMMSVMSGPWLAEDLLMKADKMSMAHSLELRVPFLDHRLVEWAACLPIECKTGNNRTGFTTKKILRQFAENRIPDTIIKRPKRGFPVPVYKWLQSKEFTRKISRSLLRKNNLLHDFLMPSEIENILRKAIRGNIDAAHKIWILIVLDRWMERWL